MASQDRTGEFRAAVTSAARVNRVPTQARPAAGSRSEFSVRASGIATDIAAAYGMLQQLTQLARRKPMFDDRPTEVTQLTFVIKQRLSQINEAIKGLQQYAKDGTGAWSQGRDQLQDHTKNVVVMLQGKLTDVTTGFTDILETRTKNIQASRTRTEKYLAPAKAATPDNPLYARTPSPSPRYSENPYEGAAAVAEVPRETPRDSLVLPDQDQTLTLLEDQQSSYLSSRSMAVDAIESTINELGGIFSQLSTMIAEQRETVQRIDANTEDVSMNISGAHRELLKYYARVSSNRALLLKSFGAVLFFFLVWVLIS